MKDDFDVQWEKQISAFFMICSPKDRKFLNVPKRNRTADDYARLMLVAHCLGFPFVLLRLAKELEKHKSIRAAVYARLDELKKDQVTVKYWLIDFLKNISLPAFQPLAQQTLAKLESINDSDFDFNNLNI